MRSQKAHALHQSHGTIRSVSVSVGTSSMEGVTEAVPEDLERHLTRRLNRRGTRLRVKRRRGDDNPAYAHKQLLVLQHRLGHARQHLAERQADLLEGQRLLELARELESARTNHKGGS